MLRALSRYIDCVAFGAAIAGSKLQLLIVLLITRARALDNRIVIDIGRHSVDSS